MQKLQMFSVYDTVAQVFNKPVFDLNNASAIRGFTMGLQDNSNKTDYELYRIGEFDDSNGTFTPEQAPVKIYTGFDITTEE